ncbi:MAG: hypothetical protein D6788_10805 [Planctomycetota bacterium]|nr:MAG: hypothetical protein D6788_10805 [Planctomycetota bacterium]
MARAKRPTRKTTGRKKAVKKKTAATAKRKKSAAKPAKAKKRTAARKTPARKGTKGAKRPAVVAKRRTATRAKTTRNNKPSATSQDPIQFPEAIRRMPRTHLSAKELREFRQMLLAKRAELCSDMERLSRPTPEGSGADHVDQTSMPIHMADVGSDTWEKEFTLGLIANEQALVREIDEALERIDNKTYGICLATHKKIDTARLRAKPWAKYCIEYARAKEEGRVP